MKSNTSIIAILFTLFVLISVVSGQTDTTSNSTTPSATASAPESTAYSIAKCLKDNGCSDSDQKCRSKCALVPDPSNTEAQNTSDCVAKCNSTLPDDKAYAQCKQDCINNNYFPQNSSPTTNNPGSSGGNSAPSGNSTDSTNGTSPSGNNSSSGNSSNSNNTSNNNSKSGASSFTTSGNAFSASILVLGVVAGVMGIGF